MTARKKSRSSKRRIKTGFSLSLKRKKSKKGRSGKKNSSFLQKLLFKFVTFIVFIGVTAWFLYSHLIPYWVFSVDSPQNILIAPRNVEEGSDVLLFAHVENDASKRALYLIDGTTKVDLVGGYGEYQLQNIYPLLQLDNKDEQFMVATFNHALGVVVDTILTVEKITPEMIGRGETAKVFYEEISSQPELAKKYLQLYYLTRTQQANLEVLNLERFSQVLSSYQTLGVQTARECPIAVVNTTDTKDLAGNISAIIEENGGLVVRITNDHSKFTNSSLYIGENSTEVCQPLIELVTRIFPASLQMIPAKSTFTDSYRAQLILFLGEDAAETLGSEL